MNVKAIYYDFFVHQRATLHGSPRLEAAANYRLLMNGQTTPLPQPCCWLKETVKNTL